MPNKLIKSSLHLQRLKFGMQTDPKKPLLQDQVSDQQLKEQIVQEGISEVGVRLSYAENRALFAIQKLLDATNYEGNTEPAQLTPQRQRHYSKPLPQLKIRLTQYLDAYGVKKTKSSRHKMEYSPGARHSALDALERISEYYQLIVYDRTTWEGKKRIKARVEYISPLIHLKRDRSDLQIIPSPILVDQSDGYFCWLPINIYDFVENQDNTKILFLEYLNYVYDTERKKKGEKEYTMAAGLEVWAKRFRMDGLIKARQWGRIRDKLMELYKLGVKLGYLKGYQIDQPGASVNKLDILTLNIDTLSSMRSGTASSKV